MIANYIYWNLINLLIIHKLLLILLVILKLTKNSHLRRPRISPIITESICESGALTLLGNEAKAITSMALISEHEIFETFLED